MSAVLGYAFFAAVFGFSIWAVAASVLPKMERIRFLLTHGPLAIDSLPPHPRASRRTCDVRITASHSRARAAA